MPSMTVKSFAEAMHTPVYAWWQILHEQKYPQTLQGRFRMSYYRPALKLIQRYYSNGNDAAIFPGAPHLIPGATNAPGNRQHNMRVLSAFMASDQSQRALAVQRSITYERLLGNTTVRGTADFTAVESPGESIRYLLYNCAEQRPSDEVIRTTLELFHSGLAHNGVDVPYQSVEFIHLQGDETFRLPSKVRKQTLKHADQTAAAIAAMWNSI